MPSRYGGFWIRLPVLLFATLVPLLLQQRHEALGLRLRGDGSRLLQPHTHTHAHRRDGDGDGLLNINPEEAHTLQGAAVAGDVDLARRTLVHAQERVVLQQGQPRRRPSYVDLFASNFSHFTMPATAARNTRRRVGNGRSGDAVLLPDGGATSLPGYQGSGEDVAFAFGPAVPDQSASDAINAARRTAHVSNAKTMEALLGLLGSSWPSGGVCMLNTTLRCHNDTECVMPAHRGGNLGPCLPQNASEWKGYCYFRRTRRCYSDADCRPRPRTNGGGDGAGDPATLDADVGPCMFGEPGACMLDPRHICREDRHCDLTGQSLLSPSSADGFALTPPIVEGATNFGEAYIGPCLIRGDGRCRKRSNMSCVVDDDCHRRPPLAGATSPMTDFGPCEFEGPGHCALRPNRSCAIDQHCSVFGPCLTGFDGGHCHLNASRPCERDYECGMQGPCDAKDKTCCSCWPYDKDARWPGVFGSPIVNNMGRMEYVWGPVGMPESRNPVSRRNQPRPQCCECTLNDTEVQEAAAAGREGANGADGEPVLEKVGAPGAEGGICARLTSLACRSDAECVDDSSSVRRTVGPCVGRGICSYYNSSVAAGDPNSPVVRSCMQDSDCARRRTVARDETPPAECLFTPPALDGFCEDNVTRLCRLDEQCGAGSPAAPTKCVRFSQGVDAATLVGFCLSDASRQCAVDAHCAGLEVGKCVLPGRCRLSTDVQCVISTQCVVGSDDLGPCILSTAGRGGYTNALAAAIAAREKHANAVQAAQNQKAGSAQHAVGVSAVTAGSRADVAFGLALDERRHVRQSIFATDSAGGLLSPSQQACLLLGPAKCREHIMSAMSAKEVDVVTAFTNLRAGDATAACLHLGAERCHMPFSQAISGSQADPQVARIISNLQSQARAKWQRIMQSQAKALDFHIRELHQLRKAAAVSRRSETSTLNNSTHSHVRQARFRDAKVAQSRLASPANASAAAGRPAADPFFEQLVRLEERKIQDLQQGMLRSRGVLASGAASQVLAQPGTQGSVVQSAERAAARARNSTASPSQHLAECNSNPPNQTADCYCRVLGPKHCSNSLFASYIHHEPASLAAIRALLQGNATSAAVTVCRVLGPEKCKESISYALNHNHIDVIQAWKFLVNGTLPLYTLTDWIAPGKTPSRCRQDADCSSRPPQHLEKAPDRFRDHQTGCFDGWCVPLLSYQCTSTEDCVFGMFCASVENTTKTIRETRSPDASGMDNATFDELRHHATVTRTHRAGMLMQNPHTAHSTVERQPSPIQQFCWTTPSCQLSVRPHVSRAGVATSITVESDREIVGCPESSFYRCELKSQSPKLLVDGSAPTTSNDDHWCAPVQPGALCCVNSDCGVSQTCDLSKQQPRTDVAVRPPPSAILRSNAGAECPVSSGGFGACTLIPNGSVCTDAGQCGNGQRCASNSSRSGHCVFGGFNKSAGSWGLSTNLGSPCSGTHQCALAHSCRMNGGHGVCRFAGRGVGCASTWECGRGYRCVLHHCILFEGTPKQPCRHDWECGAAQYCSSAGTCELLATQLKCPCPSPRIFRDGNATKVVDFMCQQGSCVTVQLGSPCNPASSEQECGQAMRCLPAPSSMAAEKIQPPFGVDDELIELSSATPTQMASRYECAIQSCVVLEDCGPQQVCSSDGDGPAKQCMYVSDGTPCSTEQKDSGCSNSQVCVRGQCVSQSDACPAIFPPRGGFISGPTARNPQLQYNESNVAVFCDLNNCLLGCSNPMEKLSISGTATISIACEVNVITEHTSTAPKQAVWTPIDARMKTLRITNKSELACVPEGVCLPATASQLHSPSNHDACVATGVCVCKTAMDARTSAVVSDIRGVTSKEHCTSLVEQSTGRPCKWKRTRVWAEGMQHNRIFVAVRSGTPRTVEFLLDSFPLDINIQQGLAGCHLPPTAITAVTDNFFDAHKFPSEWSDEDKIWCRQEAMLRPLDVALRRVTRAVRTQNVSAISDAKRIYKTLVHFGGQTGMDSHAGSPLPFGVPKLQEQSVYPWVWAKVVHADNLTVDEDTLQGLHGYLQFFPTWLCQDIRSPEGLTGCYRKAVSEFDGDCDPDTLVGCECDPTDFDESPSLECTDVPGSSGILHKSIHSQGGRGAVTRTQGVVSKPEDCDWNPFTNPLYFLFCIILKILKPIITAVFLEVESNHLLEFPQSAAPLSAPSRSAEHVSSAAVNLIELESLSISDKPSSTQQINSFDFQISNPKRSTANSLMHDFKAMVERKADRDLYEQLHATVDTKSASNARPDTATRNSEPQTFDSPRAMHGHGAVPVDWGRGVLLFGGCAAPDNTSAASAGLEYFNDVWWYRLGYDQTSRQLRWFGHMWLPAKIAGVYPAARAFHSMVSAGAFDHSSIPTSARKERIVIVFGGFNGQRYFNDLFAISHTQQSLHEISALYNASSSVDHDELQKRRAQTLNFDAAESYCADKAKMTKVDFNTSDERKGSRFCMAQYALPWHNEPFYRSTGSSDTASPWLHAPEWHGPLTTTGNVCSVRSRHSTSVIGDKELMVVYGGEGPEGLLGDVCILPLSGATVGSWVVGVPFSSKERSPRAGHAMVTVGNRAYIYGGFGINAGLLDDLVVLEVGVCSQRISSQPGPDPLDCSALHSRQAIFGSEKSLIRWLDVDLVGAQPPVGRFGHQMALAYSGLKLVIVGGYGGSGRGSNWRQRKKEIGKRNDVLLLDLRVPNVTSVWPNQISPTAIDVSQGSGGPVHFLQLPSAHESNEFDTHYVTDNGTYPVRTNASFRRSRIFVEGTNFGLPCTKLSSNGSQAIPRCNESCSAKSCNAEHWHSNVNTTRVLVGDRECTDVSWFSPTLLSCQVPFGVGADLDVRVLSNGQLTPKGNALFSYATPRVTKVVPNFFLDYPGVPRGPFQIWGRNFGFLRGGRSPTTTLPVDSGGGHNITIWIGSQRCLAYRHVSDQLLVCLCVDRKEQRQSMTPGLATVTVNVAGQWARLPKAVEVLQAPASLEPYFQRPQELRHDLESIHRARRQAGSADANIDLPHGEEPRMTMKWPEGVACPDPSDDALIDLFKGTDLTTPPSEAVPSTAAVFPNTKAYNFDRAESPKKTLDAAQQNQSAYSASAELMKDNVTAFGAQADRLLRAPPIVFLEKEMSRSAAGASLESASSYLLSITNTTPRPRVGSRNSTLSACSLTIAAPDEDSAQHALDVDRFSWRCDAACGHMFNMAHKQGFLRKSDITPKCTAFLQYEAWLVACRQHKLLWDRNCGREAASRAACVTLNALIRDKCTVGLDEGTSGRTHPTVIQALNFSNIVHSGLPKEKFFDAVHTLDDVVIDWQAGYAPEATPAARFRETKSRVGQRPFSVHVGPPDIGDDLATKPAAASREPNVAPLIQSPLLIEWVKFDDTCKVGKPPLPRRDFTMTPVAGNGFMLGSNTTEPSFNLQAPPPNDHWFRSFEMGAASFVIFGGRGLNPGIQPSDYFNQTEDDVAKPTEQDINFWADGKPVPAVDFNDTYVLLDVFSSSMQEKKQIGVTADSCPGTGSVRGSALIPPGVVGSSSINAQRRPEDTMQRPEGYPTEQT